LGIYLILIKLSESTGTAGARLNSRH